MSNFKLNTQNIIADLTENNLDLEAGEMEELTSEQLNNVNGGVAFLIGWWIGSQIDEHYIKPLWN